jgi:tetratricopeptide (TPR) repeat protein
MLVLALALLACGADEASQTAPCVAKRDFTPAQRRFVAEKLINELAMQGVMGNASTDPNPRPMLKISLVDLAETGNHALDRTGNALRSINYVLNRRGFGSRQEQVVQTDPGVMWCLTMPSDIVLLSDKATHHVTMVFRLHPDSGVIDLIDPWPEDIFLRKGHNAAGVEAKLLPYVVTEAQAKLSPYLAVARSKKLVRLTKAEFLKVLVGSSMLDGVDLPEQYLALDPKAADRDTFHLGMGMTFMAYPNDLFVREAIGHLERAITTAERASDDAMRGRAASRLHLAYRLAVYGSTQDGGSADTATAAKLARLTERFGVPDLESRYTGTDFYRLALAAGRARAAAEAVQLFGKSIALQPDHQDSYLWRGMAYTLLGDRTAAIRDATHALALNRAEQAALEKHVAERGEVGLVERERDMGKAATLEEQRKQVQRLIALNGHRRGEQ